MALQFRACRACGESHALRSDGRMSIHTTAAGTRCEEPTTHEADARAVEATRERARRDRDRARRRDELQEAFDYAADMKAKRLGKGPQPFDRRIYAVDGAQVVRGGLPTLRKR